MSFYAPDTDGIISLSKKGGGILDEQNKANHADSIIECIMHMLL